MGIEYGCLRDGDANGTFARKISPNQKFMLPVISRGLHQQVASRNEFMKSVKTGKVGAEN